MIPVGTSLQLTLQARKTGGAEGLLIQFGVKDSNNYYWWNLGGWGNTKHAIEKATDGQRSTCWREYSTGSIEAMRWYDIKIEVSGNRIRCYLDGEMIHEVEDNLNPGPLFTVAGKESSSGDLIVKVVNVSGKEQKSEIDIQGWTQ